MDNKKINVLIIDSNSAVGMLVRNAIRFAGMRKGLDGVLKVKYCNNESEALAFHAENEVHFLWIPEGQGMEATIAQLTQPGASSAVIAITSKDTATLDVLRNKFRGNDNVFVSDHDSSLFQPYFTDDVFRVLLPFSQSNQSGHAEAT